MIISGDTFEALIVGGNHVNSLTMIRCFGEYFGTVSVVLHDCSKSDFARSRYVRSILYVNDDSELVMALNHYSKNANHIIVISCSDWSAHVIDEHRDELSSSLCVFQTGRKGDVNYYMNKWNQIDLAKSCGMKVPASCFVNESVSGENYSVISFPCIVKPISSWKVGKNIRICQSKEDLSNVLSDVDFGGSLIQTMVDNKYEIVIPGFAVDKRVFLPGVVRKIRNIAGGTTYANILPFGPEHDRIKQCAEKMIIKMSYQGFFGIECIFDGEDFVFIEVNLRNDATFYAMHKAGFNIPSNYCDALYFKCISSNAQIRSLFSMSEIYDFAFVFRREISIWRWMWEYKKSSCKYVWALNDIILSVILWWKYFSSIAQNKTRKWLRDD